MTCWQVVAELILDTDGVIAQNAPPRGHIAGIQYPVQQGCDL